MQAIASFEPGVRGLIKPLHPFLTDDKVTEILINKPQMLFIEKEGQMTGIEIPSLTSPYLRRLFLMIANENKQILSEGTPLLSGSLYEGSRVQLVIPPASQHETLSIRKFKLQCLSFKDYEESHFFKEVEPFAYEKKEEENTLAALYQQKNWSSFLKKAIEYKKNIIISGATSSGKTTFLNSCLNLIKEEERLITLEDTFEINTHHKNIVRLKTIKSLSNQVPHLSMQDLVQASLRLRPDRIIMGEIRGREIFDFINVSITGHPGTLATIHATNPRVAFMRMGQLYKLNNIQGMTDKDIYQELYEVVDIIVQLNNRRLSQIYFKDVTPCHHLF